MSLGIQVNKDKIGNLIVLLADRLKPLYHSKLIMLLYLIDEEAVKDGGIPITWLDYKVWQYGPVALETYFIQEEPNIFDSYIEKSKKTDATIIKPRVSFDDSEFSDYDLEIIERVITKFGHMTSKDLVKLTHKEGTLWDIAKKENHINFDASNTTSDYSLDFTRIISDDELKLSNFKGAKETMMFRAQIEKC
jgi:uncharacterized phage-associated protein